MRVAKPVDPIRIRELKQKIHDDQYLEAAIYFIAQTLSNEIFFHLGGGNHGQKKEKSWKT